LGEDCEICFAAFGDARNNENYPLQVQPFAKANKKLKEILEKLIIEGNGGGQLHETSELAALYFVHNVSMPKAKKPILIFITDEHPYDEISAAMAKKFTYGRADKKFSDKQIFDLLKEKYSVYLIRKPYHTDSGDSMSHDDLEIYRHWVKLLGEDHIASLPGPERVVDVIFGILAKEAGMIEYFREEIEDRQKPGQVATVYKSLASIHNVGGTDSKKLIGRRSSMHKKPSTVTKKSKPLA
jgi:hypothetical protein